MSTSEHNFVTKWTMLQPAVTEPADSFDPERYLINILKRSVLHNQAVEVSHATYGKLVVFPSQGECFEQINNEAEFYSAPAGDYTIACISPSLDNHGQYAGRLGRNIDEALWKSALYASNGRLVEPCQRDDVIELTLWPNLTRLPATPNTIAMAAFFSRHPTSVTLASRILKIPLSELFIFYGSAYCAGWVTVHNRPPVLPKLKPHKNNTMLSQLLARISRL